MRSWLLDFGFTPVVANVFVVLLCHDLTTAESRVKVCAYKMNLNLLWKLPMTTHNSLGCCPFKGCGSVVDLLLYVLPIVCGSSVFVFVLLCLTLRPF